MKRSTKQRHRETRIAYQNKDIVAKMFGDQMEGKSLSLLGLNSRLKVARLLPTNLPAVRANELRMDNLFQLEDNSIAIIDYESSFRMENFLKYGYYILHTLERFMKSLQDGTVPSLRMMVLYTADIERVVPVFHSHACDIRIEPAYLTGVNSSEWLRRAEKEIVSGEISDETLMHLVLLPLTYKGDAGKQAAIETSVNLARKIEDKSRQTFALAGILTFTDKIINEETREKIKEALTMTQVEAMIWEEAIEAGRAKWVEEGKKQGMKSGIHRGVKEERGRMLKKMIRAGMKNEEIMRIMGTETTKEELDRLREETVSCGAEEG